MVTRREMVKFKKKLKMTAGILVGLAVAFLGLWMAVQHFMTPPEEGDPSGAGDGGQNVSGTQDPEEGEGKPVQNEEFLLLVNKTHPIDENYKPEDLTDIKYYAEDRDKAARYMRKEPAEQFHKLVEAAKEEGYTIVMTTAYRSYGFQKTLWDNYVKQHGEAEANTFSARPGQSEHQTGLCTDVASPSVNYQLTTEYGNTEEGKWLAEHAHQYGFIIRFPLGKEDITGYQYEPWHIRYVGQPAADEIYKKGITLEEYLDEV